MNQINMFDLTKKEIKITKPIRLIELFGGYGSQSISLEEIGADFETYKLVEFDKYAVKSYNAIHGTNFEPKDITEIHGNELEIKNTDHFCYIMTYSFPCQDLSLAGKQNGMSKGSGTRSGLLWEVERLLKEIVENNEELPQVLFMENVKQVISKKNMPDFEQWCNFLENIGYTNTYKVLNAKNYGIPQNRERCFMFSFLGNYKYNFPEPIELKLRLKDILEDGVPEKYYISEDKVDNFIKTGNVNPSGKGINGNVNTKNISDTITTNKGEGPKILLEPNDIARTIRTSGRGSLDRHSFDMILEHNSLLESKRIGGLFDGKKTKHQAGSIWDAEHLAPTLDTMQGGYRQPCVFVNEATKKGYAEAHEFDSVNLEQPKSKTRRGRVGKQVAQTLTTSCNQAVVEPVICSSRGRNPENPSSRVSGEHTEQRIEINTSGCSNCLTTVQKDNYVLEPQIIRENPLEREGWHRTAKEVLSVKGISRTISTQSNNLSTKIKEPKSLRIRKLTPKECGRLMGVPDKYIDKMLEVNSNTQCYKQFGNSIVVDCMIAMFRNLNIQNIPTWEESKKGETLCEN